MREKGFVKLHRALSLICRPEGASADELAMELGVDRRSVYRILETLESIGVPVFDEKEEFGKTVR
jgi:predicted DNA-binding transcriptional regulator YafY